MIMLLQLVIWISSLMLPLRVEIIVHIRWSLLLCRGTLGYRCPGILLYWIGLFACFFPPFAMHIRQINLKYAVDRINLPFMCQACSSDNYHQHVSAFNVINERGLPKVSEDDLFLKKTWNICIRSSFIKISSVNSGNLVCIPWCMHFISVLFQLVYWQICMEF